MDHHLSKNNVMEKTKVPAEMRMFSSRWLLPSIFFPLIFFQLTQIHVNYVLAFPSTI